MTTQEKCRLRTLRDRLSHLNYPQACKLLGTEAKRLMRRSEKFLQHVDIERDVYFRGDLFRLTLPQLAGSRQTGTRDDHAQE